jgi:uncharacterized repeat protein (TIGR03809 family)
MTHRVDVAQSRDVVARWCALAEHRLEYLTELLETGRWRRFHTELAFLENIEEAKSAVETWRGLAAREALRQNSVAISWQSRADKAPPRGDMLHDQAHRPSRQPAEIPTPMPPSDVSIAETGFFYSVETSSPPASDNASEMVQATL